MMVISPQPIKLKNSHCIGASHVRDNVDRHFSEQEQQENQQKLQQNIAQAWTQDVGYIR